MSYLGLPPTSAAFVTDTFSGTGSQTDFSMSVAPASTSSMLVVISGVMQDPSTYAIVGMTLRFSAAPPSGTGNISVRYMGIPAASVVNTAYRTVTDMTATAGQTTFTVPGYTVGFIDVFRNGARLGAADFTATSGVSVVLAVAANANDLITTVSFSVSSVLNAIPNTPGAALANIGAAGISQSYLAAGVAGTGPAFSATQNVGQSISAATWTKIQFNIELFDTASCYDNATNYRFTPNVAGYYAFNVTAESNSTSNIGVSLYKNGASYRRSYSSNPGIGATGHMTSLVYMNGTTDYVEAYIYQNSAVALYTNTLDYEFSGFMVRAA